ncbi:hypothetical protein G6011_08636 [Alternaria panax]|uniref:Uncharacterized protein n=1 Tax=Alternaria panax TaxID=48097 RepID=A0AAD4FKC2_9PLEO|nr:hypothetical protein G6011_08636 [Alternaria panax]
MPGSPVEPIDNGHDGSGKPHAPAPDVLERTNPDLSLLKLVSTLVTSSSGVDTDIVVPGTSSLLKHKPGFCNPNIHNSVMQTPALPRRGAGPGTAIVADGALWHIRLRLLLDDFNSGLVDVLLQAGLSVDYANMSSLLALTTRQGCPLAFSGKRSFRDVGVDRIDGRASMAALDEKSFWPYDFDDSGSLGTAMCNVAVRENDMVSLELLGGLGVGALLIVLPTSTPNTSPHPKKLEFAFAALS